MNVSKQTLQIGTAAIWAGVLIGVSVLTQAEQNRMLDWELMWVIVGGFIIHSILLNAYLNKNSK